MTASILAQSVRRYCNILKAMFLNKILMHEKKNKKNNHLHLNSFEIKLNVLSKFVLV